MIWKRSRRDLCVIICNFFGFGVLIILVARYLTEPQTQSHLYPSDLELIQDVLIIIQKIPLLPPLFPPFCPFIPHFSPFSFYTPLSSFIALYPLILPIATFRSNCPSGEYLPFDLLQSPILHPFGPFAGTRGEPENLPLHLPDQGHHQSLPGQNGQEETALGEYRHLCRCN